MMTSNPELLICGYLDSTATTDEIQELDALLTSDPDVRRDLILAAAQDAQISGLLRGELESWDTAAVSAPVRPMSAGSPHAIQKSFAQQYLRESSKTNWGSRVVAALAASLVLIAGGYWLLNRGGQTNRPEYVPSVSVMASIQSAEGSVEITRAERTAYAGAGAQIMAQDKVVASSNGRAEIKYGAEETTVRLLSGSTAKFWLQDNAKRINLDAGRLVCNVAKQPQGRPMRLITPNAEAKVLGTELELSVAGDSTELKVTTGNVLLTRLSDDQSVNVGAGQFATVAPGVEFVAHSSQEQKPQESRKITRPHGTTVFLREFGAILPDESTPNELVRLKEAGGEITAIVSVPWTPKSPTFRPDVYIDLTSIAPSPAAGAEVLYTIPDNVEIRIRMKSEKRGKWSLTQMPSSREFDEEHFYSGEYEVGPEWQEFVIHSGDIKPYREEGHTTRDLLPGVAIRDFNILGYGTGRLYVDRYEVASLSGTAK
jgi:hypothetical protein